MAISDGTIARIIRQGDLTIRNEKFNITKFNLGTPEWNYYKKHAESLGFDIRRIEYLPFDLRQIESGSIDLRLGNHFANIPKHDKPIALDEKLENYNDFTIGNGKYVELQPKEFILGTTQEHINLPNIIGGTVNNRSSIGRQGVFTENAGWVDPGFYGEITLELFNATDYKILLKPGMRVCQIVLEFMDCEPVNPYKGKYNGQQGATHSRIEQDYELEG
jgi:dCTP deaminase